jgi:ribose/xylose/arabinose/galactoside ABC-type transport system permease subunit
MHPLSLNAMSLRVLVVLVCCLALLATFTSFSSRVYATGGGDRDGKIHASPPQCPKGYYYSYVLEGCVR